MVRAGSVARPTALSGRVLLGLRAHRGHLARDALDLGVLHHDVLEPAPG
jgi:hypothetical protein